MYRKEAAESAKKLCNPSCICRAGCGREKKGEGSLPLLDPGFICPLEKYGITDRTPPVFPRARVTEEDVFYLCADCGNGKVEHTRNGEAVTAADGRKCLDCPVNMAWEAMQEFRAEAAMD